jgi:Nif-specific regulatory protein
VYLSKDQAIGDKEAFCMEKLSLLFKLSQSFSALITPEDLFPSIMAQTKEVFRAESCSLLLWDEARQELFFPATSDLNPPLEERLKAIRFPAEKGVAGWVLRQGKPVHVPDVVQDARFYRGIDRQTGTHTRELLCAPLRTRQGIIGVIELRNKQRGMFTDDDLAFLDALAGPVAILIENARLYEQMQQSAVKRPEEVSMLQREIAYPQRFGEIIGTSAAMAKVFALMDKALQSPITVLVQGETGTGKELIARAIHYHGPRKDRPFVAVNCGALTETLLESELFGHKRGAFTGAVTDRPGLFEVAHGGTIFLDEIGETTPALQVKLLRVLQEGEIRRVGDTQPRRVDVRLISATNKDLVQEVQEKRFREDLYYRISIFPIQLPPLRERREDIPLIVSQFIRCSNAKLGTQVQGITLQALTMLADYQWQGNVRELQNEIERAVVLAPDGTPITPECLSGRIRAQSSLPVLLPAGGSSLKQARLTFEREYVAKVLHENQDNATKTAKILGLSRQMLQQKIKVYRLRAR